jgi:hypothetical protein
VSSRARWALLLAITVLALGGALAYGVSAFLGLQQRAAAPSEVAVQAAGPAPGTDRIVFRNTAPGGGYGMAAAVPLDRPHGSRQVTDVPCDRVYAAGDAVSCLRTEPGILTKFEAAVYDTAWRERDSWPLPGIPSRTRVSPDGRLVATTSFVTGHSYAGTGFSTETAVTALTAPDVLTLQESSYSNLEDFTLLVGGRELTAVDRNIWGVTFADDGDTFYATAAAAGRNWLMRGSLAGRTMTALRETAECPSISPDGRRVAYKKSSGAAPVSHWDIAVLDLSTGRETVIPMEDSVYGQPRSGQPGDSDVWAVRAAAGSQPQLFIEHAWSPAVVRGR